MIFQLRTEGRFGIFREMGEGCGKYGGGSVLEAHEEVKSLACERRRGGWMIGDERKKGKRQATGR